MDEAEIKQRLHFPRNQELSSPQQLPFVPALADKAQAAGRGTRHAISLQISAICLLTNILIAFSIQAWPSGKLT